MLVFKTLVSNPSAVTAESESLQQPDSLHIIKAYQPNKCPEWLNDYILFHNNEKHAESSRCADNSHQLIVELNTPSCYIFTYTLSSSVFSTAGIWSTHAIPRKTCGEIRAQVS